MSEATALLYIYWSFKFLVPLTSQSQSFSTFLFSVHLLKKNNFQAFKDSLAELILHHFLLSFAKAKKIFSHDIQILRFNSFGIH